MEIGKMEIRKAETGDIPRIGELLYQVQRVHSDARPDLFKAGTRKYTDGQLLEILNDSSKEIFVAADESGRVEGYAFCIVTEAHGSTQNPVKSLYIDDLCVDSAARGHHTGTRLYEYVLEFAKKIGCYNVTLNVWADNKNAVAFYEKIGMRVQKIGMEKILNG